MRHSDENPEMKTNAYKLQRYKSVCQAWGRAWMGGGVGNQKCRRVSLFHLQQV